MTTCERRQSLSDILWKLPYIRIPELVGVLDGSESIVWSDPDVLECRGGMSVELVRHFHFD